LYKARIVLLSKKVIIQVSIAENDAPVAMGNMIFSIFMLSNQSSANTEPPHTFVKHKN